MSKPKRPRGRPRKPATTALVLSLVAVQDALSRRTYGRIKAFWREHLWAEDVRRAQREVHLLLRTGIEAIPGLVCGQLTQEVRAVVEPILSTEIRRVLGVLAAPLEGPTETSVEKRNGIPLKPRRSRTLAEARAQSARLKACLMDLQRGTDPKER